MLDPKMIKRCHFCGKKHPPVFHRYAQRNLYQRIDKMENMSHTALQRYSAWFYSKGLIVADLIVFQRLGVNL